MCSPDPKTWAKQLPFLLLAFRSLIISDTDVTPAEALYGQVLRLPGDMFASNPTHTNSEISQRISLAVEAINRIRNHDTNRRVYIPPDLSNCSHVLLRLDRLKPTFTHPYTGPYKILERHENNFVLDIKNKPVPISIDRLKPLIQPPSLSSDDLQSIQFGTQTIPFSVPTPLDQHLNSNNFKQIEPTPTTKTTRYGRIIKPVVRFTPETK